MLRESIPELQAYTGRGFPGEIDQDIAETPVAGIDRIQTQSMVRLCAATEACLYEGAFSPREICYRSGSRPALERTAETLAGPDTATSINAVAAWVRVRVLHPHLVGMTPPDRGLTEEELICSRVGWCNEQSRVFVALCEVLQIPARLCFAFHRNLECGHCCTEAFVGGKWAFVDITFAVMLQLPSGEWAEARDLMANPELAHHAYADPLRRHYAACQSWVDSLPGWNAGARPNPERGGNLLAHIGITNYLIDGVMPA